MGWRFRKSFKILPGIRLNLGKKGISGATVGPRGLSASIGKLGIFKNIGIPGTGLSHRSKIDGSPSFARALIGLGIVVLVIVGVVGLCIFFAVIGGSRQQEQSTPARQLVNTPVTPAPQPTRTPIKKKPKRNG